MGSASANCCTEPILTEERYGTKIAILNRSQKLNSLNAEMITRLGELYEMWEKDPHVHLVIIKGLGRSFCAGGDLSGGYNNTKAGRIKDAIDFFRREYTLNYIVGTYKKPYIAIINGWVMGGGTGISILGRFRVATENAIFSMPETAIGLHPDAGASYYFSHLPGHLGEYLGLTGARLDGADMKATSLATHFVPSHRLAVLEERLCGLNTEDAEVISNVLDEYCDVIHLRKRSPLHRIKEINSCFGQSCMEEIIQALKAGLDSGNPWYQETLNVLRKASPYSLKTSLRSIREGRRKHLHDCLRNEFRLSVHALVNKYSTDFQEGFRAVLLEKDNKPKWNPASLEDVTPKSVEYSFSPVGEICDELQLPVDEREPQLKHAIYSRL